MVKDYLEYKGYYTRIEFSPEDKILFGKIEGINDLVNFEAESALDIENEFHLAVDDYLVYCESIGVEPDKSYKGSFNVRVSPELHKKAAIEAFKKGFSLNELVSHAISNYLKKEKINVNLSIYQSEGQKTSSLRTADFVKNKQNTNIRDYVMMINPNLASKLN